MDARVRHKKLRLKERHAAMTRGLSWQPSYQARQDVFAFGADEGIKIHHWNAFEEPFRMTMDGYWKLQAAKEKKLYAVLEAFGQNNGQLGVTDARYVNALKLFVQAFTPLAYCAHRGFAHLGRQFGGDDLRVACQLQAVDLLRHYQIESHAFSHFNKFFNGMHSASHWYDTLWYLSVSKSYIEDAHCAGPFELLTAFSFSFDNLVSNLLFVPLMTGAAHNGDLSAVSVGFSAHSDQARHMALGVCAIKFILRQDPANLPIVQRWVDKWFWRGYRLLTLVAMMQDYMLPKRTMSWKEGWELYVEGAGAALFDDLVPYGLRKPAGWADACDGKDHISHQAWNGYYGYSTATAFHTWVPSASEMDWLAQKYPSSFRKFYRPRLEHYRDEALQGRRWHNKNVPMQCATCQFPMLFTEPGNPRLIAYREREIDGEPHHFCSDHCLAIFDHEPAKYLHARLAVQAIFEGREFNLGADPRAASFDALNSLLDGTQMNIGRDNGEFEASEDERQFAQWGGGQSPKEGVL
jgi:phenol/toluene 2-monooxygenase (NADH) P3/A3